MQQFLAQFSYSALSTRVWMHRSLIVLSHRLISIYTILYIKICYRKYIHVYIVGVPARICIYMFKNMDQCFMRIMIRQQAPRFIVTPNHRISPRLPGKQPKSIDCHQIETGEVYEYSTC